MSKNQNLPKISENIQWVTPEKFSVNKIILGKPNKSNNDGITRVNILYKYSKNEEPKLLYFVPIKDSDAYFRTNGIEEETYMSTDGKSKVVNTGRNIVKFFLDDSNKHHEKFSDVLHDIKNQIEELLNIEASFRGCYDLVNDDRETTGYVITSRIIESNDGTVYTSVYNDDGQIDIKNLGKCIARPALTFSYVVPNKDRDNGKRKINVSLSQMYCKTANSFPLRDRD